MKATKEITDLADAVSGHLSELNDLAIIGGLIYHFETRGIRGVLGECSECPIARELKRRMPGHEFNVGHGHVTVGEPNNNVSIVLPEMLNHFVREFDAECHPQLISERLYG